MKYDVKDLKKAKEGRQRIEWAQKEMPVLSMLRENFCKEKPLKNVKMGCCLHVTTETANLAVTLKSAGATVFFKCSRTSRACLIICSIR